MFCRKCGMLNNDNDYKCVRCEEVLQQVDARNIGRQSGEMKPDGAITVLILAVVGWSVCGVCGVVAWVMGNDYLERCRRAGVEPESAGVVGRILGMVQTILMGAVFLIFIIFFAFAVLNAN